MMGRKEKKKGEKFMRSLPLSTKRGRVRGIKEGK